MTVIGKPEMSSDTQCRVEQRYLVTTKLSYDTNLEVWYAEQEPEIGMTDTHKAIPVATQ